MRIGETIMTTKSNIWFKIMPWLLGILLSIAGMSLGYLLGSDTASLLGGEPGIWARLGKGFVWGAIIAGLQWFIVRAAGVPPIWFIVLSAVSFSVGYPLGQTFQLIIVHHWSLDMTGYWLAVFTFGLFLSLPQWIILHRYIQRAGLWILISMIGWMLTGLMWLSGGQAGIEYGIVTGLGLVWLVNSQSSKLKAKVSS